MRKITRRTFLGQAAVSAAALAVPAAGGAASGAGGASLAANRWPGRVVAVSNSAAVEADGKIRSDLVREMVDRAVLELTGADSVAAAWAMLLPGLQPTDAVGIKVNVINPKLPTHPEVVAAVVDGLLAMGMDANRILIWDRVGDSALGSFPKSGYPLNAGDSGVRCLGTDHEQAGWDPKVKVRVSSVGLEFPVSRLAGEMVKYTINLPVLKDHNVPGITYALKNYYGCIPLLDAPLLAKVKAARMHTGHGDPQIAELYNHPVFRDKTRLHLGDALLFSHVNGPGGPATAAAYTLHAATDPVAMDSVGLEIIDRKRQEAGLPAAAEKAGYLQAAARLGLGVADHHGIELRELKLG